MRKAVILLLLLAVSVSTFAQLRVNSDGSVRMASATNNNTTTCMLHVGDTAFYGYSSQFGIISSLKDKTAYMGVGVKGAVSAASATGTSPNSRIGVWGEAGYGNSYCYGIAGQLTGNSNGAGVFGTIANTFTPAFLPGQYAGLFNGETLVSGDFTATNVYTYSDIRLKDNVSDLLEGESTKAVDKLMDVNVIKYNLKKEAFGYYDNDDPEIKGKATTLLHFGVSAQELQELYPNLVKEGQDGYLAVNYSELVPVLIRSIQELKQELDEVKGSGESRMTRAAFNSDSEFQPSTKNVLYQNTPNPFKEQTIIRFRLADNARDASICIFDMTGKMLKKLPISSGASSVSVNGWELGEGLFLYTLIVNGREIDTKRMLIIK